MCSVSAGKVMGGSQETCEEVMTESFLGDKAASVPGNTGLSVVSRWALGFVQARTRAQQLPTKRPCPVVPAVCSYLGCYFVGAPRRPCLPAVWVKCRVLFALGSPPGVLPLC